jgi:hypothetical protein
MGNVKMDFVYFLFCLCLTVVYATGRYKNWRYSRIVSGHAIVGTLMFFTIVNIFFSPWYLVVSWVRNGMWDIKKDACLDALTLLFGFSTWVTLLFKTVLEQNNIGYQKFLHKQRNIKNRQSKPTTKKEEK